MAKTTKPRKKTPRQTEKAKNADAARKRVADKKPRATQKNLKGEGFPKPVPEIDKAANAYVKVRDERVALSADEVKRKASLLDAMKKNGLTVYRYDSRIVEIVPEGETVKVKASKSDDDVTVATGRGANTPARS